jgi:hypothetical protein
MEVNHHSIITFPHLKSSHNYDWAFMKTNLNFMENEMILPRFEGLLIVKN